jgi:hypothetical protein
MLRLNVNTYKQPFFYLQQSTQFGEVLSQSKQGTQNYNIDE